MVAASAANGDEWMIAAARSRFSDYRFDGGTADCLRGFVVTPVVLWRLSFISSRACVSHLPGRGDCVFLACPCPYHAPAWRPVRPHRRRALVTDTPRASVIVPHHLIISCGGGGFVLIVVRCRLINLCSLFSSWAAIVRRTAGVVFHLPLPRSRMSWGKRRGMRFLIHHPLMPSGFSFLVSPCRLVGRLVPFSCLICHHGVCSWRCRVLRSCPCCLVVGRDGIHLSCSVAWCLASSFAYRLVRFSSCRLVGVSLLVSHVLRGPVAWRACPSRLWLLFSCRGAKRSSRLAVASRCSSRGAGRVWRLVLSRR